MYSMPKQKGKEKEIDKGGRHYEPAVDENGEDEMVKKFKENLRKRQSEKEKGHAESKEELQSGENQDNTNDHVLADTAGEHESSQIQTERKEIFAVWI